MIKSNNNNEEDVYLQIKAPKRVEVKIKASRFIASAGKVSNEDEVTTFIESVSKEFHDATHNCYAWRIGSGKHVKYRYADNGEPSGTAGLPIFRVIEGRRFSNIIIVVTRYFGGIKLGTGGLIRAYSKVTMDVLNECEIEKTYPVETAKFKTSFEFVSLVYNIISSFKANLIDSTYSDQPTFKIEIRASKYKEFKSKLKDATNGQVEFFDFF